VKLDLELVGLALLLCGLIWAAIVVVVRARRSLGSDADETKPQSQLDVYRALLENGTINQEEFERISGKLTANKDEAASKTNAVPPPGSSTTNA